MTSLTLQQMVVEKDVRKPFVQVIIGGVVLPKWTSVDYSFKMGSVPTASITVPGRHNLPAAVVEEASVQIWFGYYDGLNIQAAIVYGGGVVDSISYQDREVIIECVQDGARKLTYSYNRRINQDFTVITAEEAVLDLLTLAGVNNYYILLDPWLIGTAAPQEIQFSTYGEAINKVSEVDGSPWYCLPTGQVRVENRDPIPSPSARRTYFTNIMTGLVSTAPVEIDNLNARPRINAINKEIRRSEVANFIHVEGAVITTLGPNGEQNSNQIYETVDGSSGQFPNGAYWIPTPPLFQDYVFSNELIDTAAKAFQVAERYYDLKNRLFEKMKITVPGDPDIFLGSTVRVVDKANGINSLYFVEAYSTTINEGNITTQIDLTGGPESGTTGYAAPFAEFFWTYAAFHQWVPLSSQLNLTLPPMSDIGAQLCIDIPALTGFAAQGGNFGTDKRTVVITIDGTASQDFDGTIVTYEWSYTDALDVVQTLSGPRITLIFDPDVTNSIELTLLVTDDTGRTSDITKTIFTSADYLTPPATDPNINNTPQGGGIVFGPCSEVTGQCGGMEYLMFIAAGDYAMGSFDNRIWNDLAKGTVGVSGDFVAVSAVKNDTGLSFAAFGTDQGEVVVSIDACVTGTFTFQIPGAPRINRIVFDQFEMGAPAQGATIDTQGVVPGVTPTVGGGGIPVYTINNPGSLTIMEAYQQALAVGFDAYTAITAVAIMMAESSLYSGASNSTGNTPPSTDRGIVQINNYWHPDVSDDCAYNTACAIQEMYRISSGGTWFVPWSAYNAGTYEQFLSQVQEAVGVSGSPIGTSPSPDPKVPPSYTPAVALGIKFWLCTQSGAVYVSNDSGTTWELWRQFEDGLSLEGFLIDERLRVSEDAPTFAVFGGSSSQPDTLFRIAQNRTGAFFSLTYSGVFGSYLTSNPGLSVIAAALNASALLLVLSDGTAWVSSNPLEPSSWEQCQGDIIGAPISNVNSGYDAEFILTDEDGGVHISVDNVNFINIAIVPFHINQIRWLGFYGTYIAAVDDGFVITTDFGSSWGYMRPSTEFTTTWPAGSFGNEVTMAMGIRYCVGWQCGDVIVGGYSYEGDNPAAWYVYSPDGTLKETLTYGDGITEFVGGSCEINPVTGNLYAIVGNTAKVVVFDAVTHQVIGTIEVPLDGDSVSAPSYKPTDLMFDNVGNFYIFYEFSTNNLLTVRKFDGNGNMLSTFEDTDETHNPHADLYSADIAFDGSVFYAGTDEGTDERSAIFKDGAVWTKPNPEVFPPEVSPFKLLPNNQGVVTPLLRFNANGVAINGYDDPSGWFASDGGTIKDVAVDKSGLTFWTIAEFGIVQRSVITGEVTAGPFLSPPGATASPGTTSFERGCTVCTAPKGVGAMIPGGDDPDLVVPQEIIDMAWTSSSLGFNAELGSRILAFVITESESGVSPPTGTNVVVTGLFTDSVLWAPDDLGDLEDDHIATHHFGGYLVSQDNPLLPWSLDSSSFDKVFYITARNPVTLDNVQFSKSFFGELVDSGHITQNHNTAVSTTDDLLEATISFTKISEFGFAAGQGPFLVTMNGESFNSGYSTTHRKAIGAFSGSTFEANYYWPETLATFDLGSLTIGSGLVTVRIRILP